MSEQGISGLLRLPRELRDHIYSYLLHEYAEPPPNPSFPGERITSKHDGIGVRGLQVFSISYPKNPRRCQYAGLLRTSHQLRDEVMECVDKCVKSGNSTAKLDIMCKGYQVWPTWVNFPLFTRPSSRAQGSGRTEAHMRNVPNLNVDVQLRIFSTEGFRSNDGWPRQPGSSFRDLFSLLLQFIEFGPDFGISSSKSEEVSRVLFPTGDGLIEQRLENRLCRINRLSVDVAFHDMYTRATHPETVHWIFKALKELALSGFFRHRIESVRARAMFTQDKTDVEWENLWAVAKLVDLNIMGRWNDHGFVKFQT